METSKLVKPIFLALTLALLYKIIFGAPEASLKISISLKYTPFRPVPKTFEVALFAANLPDKKSSGHGKGLTYT